MKKALLFLFLLGSLSASAVKRILFIGNSYTYVNDLPYLVYGLALSNGDTLIYDSSTPGGYTFQLHCGDANTLSKISSQSWDYVVLQEQSQLPSFSPTQVQTEVYPYALRLDSLIKANNPCTQTVFYMTWGRKYGDQSNCAVYPPVCTYTGMQERLRESYLEMGDLTHSRVSPVGISWQNSIIADSSLDLYATDYSHPSLAGSYLAACTFYAALFKKSPVGNTFISSLPQATATYLQNIAAHTVLDSLSTWKIGMYEPNALFTYTQSGLAASFLSDSAYASNHSWSFGGSTAALSYTFPSAGDYSVTHIACDSCRCDTSVQVVHISSIGIEEQNLENLISISPNPALAEIKIKVHHLNEADVQVSDISGKIICIFRINDKEPFLLEKKNFNSGLYFLRFEAKNYRSVTKKIVFQ